jgi:hypothetical protein
MIYFVQAKSGGSVMIGFTNNLDSRLKQLQATYGRELVVLATMEGGLAEERGILSRFEHLRLGRAEQFRPSPELMEFIGRPVLSESNSDAIEAIPQAGAFLQRSSLAWKQAVEAFAEWDRAPSVSDLIDRAIIAYAREKGYSKAFPRR